MTSAKDISVTVMEANPKERPTLNCKRELYEYTFSGELVFPLYPPSSIIAIPQRVVVKRRTERGTERISRMFYPGCKKMSSYLSLWTC